MYAPAGVDASAYKDGIFLSPHKFIGGPGTPGVLVMRRELMTNRVPVVPGGGTVMYVNPVEHRYYDDPEHREEGGTAGHRRVDPCRAGLPAQDRRRHGDHPGPRGGAARARGDRLEGRAPHRDPRQPRGAAALDRQLRGAGTERRLPPPQLRRRGAQRPLRHPDPRRLLVRGAVRPPPAAHRPRALPRVRAADRRRLRGHQARLGAGQLQLLRRRPRRRLRDRGRADGRPRRLAAAGRLRLRPDDGAVAAPRRSCRAAHAPARRVVRRDAAR